MAYIMAAESTSPATYLLTGTAGFIGFRVAEMLLQAGHRVVGVDNLAPAYDLRIKEWRLDQIKKHPNFTYHHFDISDVDSVANIFKHQQATEGKPFAAVINLAARAGVRASIENPAVYVQTNITGTLNLLNACRDFEVKKFILSSTSSLYGEGHPAPYLESLNTERMLSPYAATKKAAEVLCYTYHYLYKIDMTIFRYFTVYGPAGRPDMMPFKFVQRISEGRTIPVFGDGKQSRDFTYVDDIARGTILGLKPVGYEIVNLGSDEPIILSDAIALMEKLIGKKSVMERLPRHPADVVATWANIDKAKSLLGWKPQVSFEQGIQNTINWYNANRSWASEINT